MAKLQGLELSKSGVSQTLNLEQVLGVSFRGEKELRLAIAQRVIDHIIERTENDIDIHGGEFTKYSKEYKDSTIFNLLKDDDTPNMRLTGNMLAAMDVLGDGPNSVIIGFKDKTEILKAFNHNTGDTVPKREFFGVTQKEIKDMVKNDFADDIARLQGKDPGRTTIADVINRGLLVTQTQTGDALAFVFNTIEDFGG